MEQLRNIKVSLEDARKWYKGHNETLKELACKAFPVEDLNEYDYHKIVTFCDACQVLGVKPQIKDSYPRRIKAYIMLNYIVKALNLGFDVDFTKGKYWIPEIKVTIHDLYRHDLVKLTDTKFITTIYIDDKQYDVYYNGMCCTYNEGISNLSKKGICEGSMSLSLLGCATPEIAKFLGLNFGSLISEVLYGDFR